MKIIIKVFAWFFYWLSVKMCANHLAYALVFVWTFSKEEVIKFKYSIPKLFFWKHTLVKGRYGSKSRLYIGYASLKDFLDSEKTYRRVNNTYGYVGDLHWHSEGYRIVEDDASIPS